MRFRGLAWFFVLLLLATVLLPLPALRGAAVAQSPIIATETVVADFPNSITFKVTASSTSPITRLVLRYQIERVRCLPESVDQFPKFTPATRVDTEWLWDMRKTGGLPPGAELTYRWLMRDAQGNEGSTPERTFRFEDTRRQWRSVSQGLLTLYWYSGQESFARELLRAATEGLGRLSRDTGIALERPVRLYIYASAAEMQGARIFPQEWEGGVAFPAYGIVSIGIAPEEIAWGRRSMVHELSHIVVFFATRSCSGGVAAADLPTWLSEGLAVHNEGEPEPFYESRLRQAVAENRLISVRTLSSSFPADREQALLSYAQSGSLVSFLVKDFGREKMNQLLMALKAGKGYDAALLQVYGFDTDGLEERWRQYIGAPPRPILAPSPTPVSTPIPTPAPVATPAPVPPGGTVATAPPATLPPGPLPSPPPGPGVTPQPTPSPRRAGLGCALGGDGVPVSDLGLWLLGAMLGFVFLSRLASNRRKR